MTHQCTREYDMTIGMGHSLTGQCVCTQLVASAYASVHLDTAASDMCVNILLVFVVVLVADDIMRICVISWIPKRGFFFFFFSSRRRHTRCSRDWSSDVCSSD